MRAAAVDLIAKYGYQNVSLRRLAEDVGLHAGSLYNHINNKQEFLFLLLKEIMEDLLEQVEVNVLPVRGSAHRLRAFVHAHTRFHTSRLSEVFIGSMELRNLEPENFAVIARLRARYYGYLRAVVEDGVNEGMFKTSDVGVATRGILGMLNYISVWFKLNGPMSPNQLADMYVEMVFGALGASAALEEIRHEPAASVDKSVKKRPAAT